MTSKEAIKLLKKDKEPFVVIRFIEGFEVGFGYEMTKQDIIDLIYLYDLDILQVKGRMGPISFLFGLIDTQANCLYLIS